MVSARMRSRRKYFGRLNIKSTESPSAGRPPGRRRYFCLNSL
jgi:hypothetical protein